MSAVSAEQPTFSIEPGHFYAATFAQGTEVLTREFGLIKHFVDVRQGPDDSVAFLFDDYHNRPGSRVRPQDIYTQLRESSDQAGIKIDYIAREGACTRMAEHVLGILRTTGYLCETENQGFLLDERPKSLRPDVAMSHNSKTRSLGFPYSLIDIEVYDRPKGTDKSWACPYLAAIWQGLRLGVLHDEAFDAPVPVGDAMPDWDTWEDVPPLVQLTPDAKPFVTDKTFSVLPGDFLQVEAAVDKILSRLGTTIGEIKPLAQRTDRVFL
jgi:hypothetical protein